MIQKFIDAFLAAKPTLEQVFKSKYPDSYRDLLVEVVKHLDGLDADRVAELEAALKLNQDLEKISYDYAVKSLTRAEAAEAEVARLRDLVAYIAGMNADHVQVALMGNPNVCEAIVNRARAAMQEKTE